jgi:hypothetical protein
MLTCSAGFAAFGTGLTPAAALQLRRHAEDSEDHLGEIASACPSPIRSPTTTSPVAMPTRTCNSAPAAVKVVPIAEPEN